MIDDDNEKTKILHEFVLNLTWNCFFLLFFKNISYNVHETYHVLIR